MHQRAIGQRILSSNCGGLKLAADEPGDFLYRKASSVSPCLPGPVWAAYDSGLQMDSTHHKRITKKVALPEPVARIYKATAELEALYPGRKFTPDGHLVGSIGEVIAAEALGLKLYPMSHVGHDAFDSNGDVQIKMTAGTRVAMYATCARLVVLRVVSPEEAEIVYDGPGQPVWEKAGKIAKNGQRSISLYCLRAIDGTSQDSHS